MSPIQIKKKTYISNTHNDIEFGCSKGLTFNFNFFMYQILEMKSRSVPHKIWESNYLKTPSQRS